MNLYEIESEWLLAIDNTFDPETGEADEASLAFLDSLQNKRDEKVENLLKYRANIEADEESLTREIERLKEKKEKLSKKRGWIENYIDIVLGREGKDKKFSFLSWNIKWNKGTSTIIDSEDLIPEIYKTKEIKEIIKIDKAKIKESLKKGEEVAGARLETNYNISIK